MLARSPPWMEATSMDERFESMRLKNAVVDAVVDGAVIAAVLRGAVPVETLVVRL